MNRFRWFGHVQRMEENRIPKRVFYMSLGTIRFRGRPRNRWQNEVREDGRIVGGEGWQEKVHNREEWKKLLRTARNRRILHMPMEWTNMTVTRCSPIPTFTLKIQAAICSAITVPTYRATLYCPGYYRFQNVNCPISNKNLSNTKIVAHVFVSAKQLMIACTGCTVQRPAVHTCVQCTVQRPAVHTSHSILGGNRFRS